MRISPVDAAHAARSRDELGELYRVAVASVLGLSWKSLTTDQKQLVSLLATRGKVEVSIGGIVKGVK